MAVTPATFGQSVLDAELDAIQDNGTKLGLCKNFLRSDNFATTDGKIIASKAITSGHALWGTRTDDTSGGNDDVDAPSRRQFCTSVELDAATGAANGTTDELSLVILSGSEVLAVTDETTDRAVSVDDVITTFSFYIQASQPGSV